METETCRVDVNGDEVERGSVGVISAPIPGIKPHVSGSRGLNGSHDVFMYAQVSKTCQYPLSRGSKCFVQDPI